MTTSTPPGDAGIQVTTASSPHEYTGDAASRVFDITELLEQILLFAVASQSEEAKEKDSKILKMPPMPGCGNVSAGGICLFRIQRVSKTFRHTIQGSTKLKQLIYLAPPSVDTPVLWEDENSQRVWPSAYQPFQSLVSLLNANVEYGFVDFFVVRKWGGEKTLVTDMNKLFIDDCASTYGQIIGQLPNGWHNPEASWRVIKICHANEPSQFKYSFWSDLEDDDDAPPFFPSWQLGGDVTLEYVFELYSIVLEALDEYIPKKKLMNREYAIARGNAETRWAGKELLHGRNNPAMLDELNGMFEQSIEDAFAMGREMVEVIASRTNEIGKSKGSCWELRARFAATSTGNWHTEPRATRGRMLEQGDTDPIMAISAVNMSSPLKTSCTGL